MSRFRIDLVAPPMSGHLHPMLGIGRRLSEDFDVRIISTAGALAEIAAAGLRGRAMLGGADAAIAAIVNPPHPVRSNPWRLNTQLRGSLAMLERFQSELRALWQDAPPDLVIADFTVPVAGSLAAERGIRWWTAAPSPCAMETPDGPPSYLGGWTSRDGWIWRLRDAAGRRVVRVFKHSIYRLHRDALRRMGFPSVYRPDGTEAIYSPERVLALGLAELEFPRRYPAHVDFLGPVLYTPPSDAAPPSFVAGRSHVLVTVGTHLAWRKAAVAAAVQRVANGLPDTEFHFTDGDRSSGRRESAGNLYRCGFISYARDLSRYDIVVHHAGAGVLAHTLAAGIPSIVVPADYDQFDNAARLVAAGVAVRVKQLDELSMVIPQVLNDRGMRARCQKLQAVLAAGRAEDRIAAMVHDALG